MSEAYPEQEYVDIDRGPVLGGDYTDTDIQFILESFEQKRCGVFCGFGSAW